MNKRRFPREIAPFIGEKIIDLVIVNNRLVLTFADGTRIEVFDDGQDCCEIRYMHTDDVLTDFVGSCLIGIEVRDVPNKDDDDVEEHEIQFLIVSTTLGVFTVETHNVHNGYYGGFMLRVEIEKEGKMKTLPNGVKIFNATPHPIRFWDEEWDEPVEVETDEVITATVSEETVAMRDGLTFVRTRFTGTNEGSRVAQEAYENGADVVVGSIIAAQAYPGLVFGMTPAPGYERVPPREKRMKPDKFTTFEESQMYFDLYYDNGTGFFDCASRHYSLVEAFAAARSGWQTEQYIKSSSGVIVWRSEEYIEENNYE